MSVWDSQRHMRAALTEPGKWNELCIGSSATWRTFPSTSSLTNEAARVTCTLCQKKMEQIPVERRWWK